MNQLNQLNQNPTPNMNNFTQELHESKEQLRKTNEAHDLLLDTLDEMIWSIDVPTQTMKVSAACERIFGLKREELWNIYDVWRDFIYPADHILLDRAMAEAMKGLQAKVQYRITHKNGSTKWLETKIIPTLNDKGDLVRMNGITRDITKEKKSQKALLESEFLFRQFFDNAHEAILVLDVNTGLICDYNQNALKLFKMSGTEMLKKTPTSLSPEYQPDDVLSSLKAEYIIERTIAGKKPVFEWLFLDAAGREIPCEVRLSTITVYERKLIRGSIIDITERKKAERTIRASEERYRLVSENPSLGIGWASIDGKILKANKALCNMLQCTEDEITGLNFIDFTHPDDLETEIPLFKQLASREITNYIIEKRYIKKNKDIIWVELNISSFIDENGELKYFIGVIQDISARKIAETKIMALNESLEAKVRERTAALIEANRELEAFNGTVSHDLQAPLRAVAGFSKILMAHYSEKLDAEGKEILEIMNTSTLRMSRLIKELLEFAKLSKATVSTEPVNMDEIVKEVVDEVRFNQPYSVAEIKIDNVQSACCDPILTKQVWVNLISNAVKYSSKKDKPVVEIGSDLIKGEVVYHVKDNGTGFDMKQADKLFNVFKRLHKDDDFEGTGIGLATAHRIVTRQGGRIWADAKPFQGATFYFTLAA